MLLENIFIIILLLNIVININCAEEKKEEEEEEQIASGGYPDESFDCNLIREYVSSRESSPESILENDFLNSHYHFLKCGILPARLVNNKETNAIFLIKWTFLNAHLIELEFRLDSVENYSMLNYYYSIRRFDHEEFYSGVKAFQPLPDEYPMILNSTDHKNTLLLNMHTISIEYNEEYDLLHNAFVICTIVLNLRDGFEFTLPFMCVDVFFDDFYYEKDKINSLADIIFTLVPLAVFTFIIIAIFYKPIRASKEARAARIISFSTIDDSVVSFEAELKPSRKYSRLPRPLHRRSLVSLDNDDDDDEIVEEKEIIHILKRQSILSKSSLSGELAQAANDEPVIDYEDEINKINEEEKTLAHELLKKIDSSLSSSSSSTSKSRTSSNSSSSKSNSDRNSLVRRKHAQGAKELTVKENKPVKEVLEFYV